MRNLIIYLSALHALSPCSYAVKHGAAQLRDLLAYPKFEVQFLNHLPVSASDADLAKSFGVEREDEWLDLRLSGLSDRRRLGDGSSEQSAEDVLELVPMSLVPPGGSRSAEYLCLMPSRNSTESQTAVAEIEDHAETELDPVQSWSALSHLDGKCLYSKQGWFTYSYCHNSHIRQFREARHHHPHPPGGYEPEEDTSYDAYTLGKAAQPPSRRRVSGQAVTEPPNSVSFGVGASSRYLVQRWSDGTLCDKTNRPREIEVQIHCSMTTNDIIYLVKEMAICQYVIVIHSPHLCGLPGFKAPQADVEPAGIRCRQLIEDEDFETWLKGDEDKKKQETLKLPWSTPRAAPKRDATATDADDEQEDASPSTEFSVEELSVGGEEFMALLNKALAAKRAREHPGDGAEVDEEEDIVVLALNEDEEGNMVLDAELVDGDEIASEFDTASREFLLSIVKQFLENKEAANGVREYADREEDEDEEGGVEGGGSRHDEL